MLNGLLAQVFFYILGFSTFTSGFALFAERRFTWHGHPFTPREVGAVLIYVGALGIILQGGLIGKLVKRFGEPILVSSGFISADRRLRHSRTDQRSQMAGGRIDDLVSTATACFAPHSRASFRKAPADTSKEWCSV